MSSQDGNRSMRASKRYSVTALYLSMNANQKDLEIEDDLARGMDLYIESTDGVLTMRSAKSIARPEVKDFVAVEEELRSGERCAISGFADSLA